MKMWLGRSSRSTHLAWGQPTSASTIMKTSRTTSTRSPGNKNPLTFEDGAVKLSAGYGPRLDREVVESMTVEKIEF